MAKVQFPLKTVKIWILPPHFAIGAHCKRILRWSVTMHQSTSYIFCTKTRFQSQKRDWNPRSRPVHQRFSKSAPQNWSSALGLVNIPVGGPFRHSPPCLYIKLNLGEVSQALWILNIVTFYTKSDPRISAYTCMYTYADSLWTFVARSASHRLCICIYKKILHI